jgi:hypothetical protein
MADIETRTSHSTVKFGVFPVVGVVWWDRQSGCVTTRLVKACSSWWNLFGSYIRIPRSDFRFVFSHCPLRANRLQRGLCTKFRHCLYMEAESTATHIAVEPCNYDLTGDFVRRVISRYHGDVRLTWSFCLYASVTFVTGIRNWRQHFNVLCNGPRVALIKGGA